MIESRPPEGGHVGWIPDRYGGATLKIEHQLIETNGVTLHVATAGPPDGKLVLLLHGFPEYWYGWRHQIPVLAAAGFRVVVPDQRGFNESERPEGVTPYATAELAADAAGLIRAFGRESAFVVGHDFGATVAWWLSLTEPSMIERLVCRRRDPRARALARHLTRSPRSKLRWRRSPPRPRRPTTQVGPHSMTNRVRHGLNLAVPRTRWT